VINAEHKSPCPLLIFTQACTSFHHSPAVRDTSLPSPPLLRHCSATLYPRRVQYSQTIGSCICEYPLTRTDLLGTALSIVGDRPRVSPRVRQTVLRSRYQQLLRFLSNWCFHRHPIPRSQLARNAPSTSLWSQWTDLDYHPQRPHQLHGERPNPKQSCTPTFLFTSSAGNLWDYAEASSPRVLALQLASISDGIARTWNLHTEHGSSSPAGPT
jgi:hypothetical protein